MDNYKLKNFNIYLFIRIFVFNFVIGYLYYINLSLNYSKNIFFMSIIIINIIFIINLLIKEFLENVKIFFIFNLILDVIFITVLTFFDGGIFQSSLSLLYYLIIITSSYFFYDKISIIIASFISFMYLIFSFLIVNNIIIAYDIFGNVINYSSVDYGFSYMKVFINIVLFYVTVFIISNIRFSSYLKDQKIKKQKILIEDIYKNIQAFLLVFNNKGFLTNSNQIGEKLFKKSIERNLHYKNILPEKIIEFIEDYKLNNIKNASVFEIDDRFYEISINNIQKDNEYIGFIISIKDITEKREIENKIQEIDKLAYVGKVGANIAHELRNPMASLYGSIQLLNEKNFDEKDKKLYNLVLNEADRLNKIIQNFLDFTEGKEAQFVKVNLADIIEKNVEMVKLLTNKNISIVKKEDCYVKIDEILISQAINNLLWNAVEEINSNGKVSIEIQKFAEKCKINIVDNGKGIPENEINKIFNPFYSKKDKGMGLGLSIVKKNILNNGGDISVKSKEGEGTKFIITLPIAE